MTINVKNDNKRQQTLLNESKCLKTDSKQPMDLHLTQTSMLQMEFILKLKIFNDEQFIKSGPVDWKFRSRC